jgi:GNAT superfamily N-acetyltransferase
MISIRTRGIDPASVEDDPSPNKSVDDLVIDSLVRHREVVPRMAEWHWRDDGSRTPLEFWIEAHEAESVGEDVPTAWVAFLSGRPVGCVSLIRQNMDSHPELTPWLAALYVVPEERRRGIGTLLTRRCEDAAASLGYGIVYLYTELASDFYARLGWRVRSVEEYEDDEVTITEKELVPVVARAQAGRGASPGPG